MKRIKPIIFILFAIGLGAILAIIIAVFQRQQLNRNTQPTLIPTPSSTSTVFKIISVNPSGAQEIVIPNIAISVIFSQDVNPETISVSSIPDAQLTAQLKDQDPQVLYIKPQNKWGLNQTYNIKLTATSVTGELINNYQISFTPRQITVGDPID